MRRNTGENPEQPGSQHEQGRQQGQPPSQQGQQPPPQRGQQPPQGEMPPMQQGQPQQGGPQQLPPQGQQSRQRAQQGGPPPQQGQRSQRGQPSPAPGPQTQPQQGPMGQQPPGGQGPPQMQQPSQQQGGQQMGQQGMGSGGMTGGGMSPGMMSQQGTMGQPGGMQQQAMGAQGMQQPGVGPHLESVDIEDVIQTDVVTAATDTPTPTLAGMMAEEDVGSVVIVDDGEPVGIITDRKLALLMQEAKDITEQTAEDIMTGELVTGTTSMTVLDVLNQMSEQNIRRFPITDEDGSLEGIVTLDDLLVLLSTEMQKATEIIQEQSSRL